MGPDRAAPAALAREGSRPAPGAGSAVPAGILYVLYNDIVWQLLPLERFFGSGQTCWRRIEQ